MIIGMGLISVLAKAQHKAESFSEYVESGATIEHLDSVYKSAVHTDTALAVFKNESEQLNLGVAYIHLLKDLGKFLKENDFKWGKATKGFNRIYFAKDGSIDYFLYNFSMKSIEEKDRPSKEKVEQFKTLLNKFIATYKISMTADVSFAQCSPVTYIDW